VIAWILTQIWAPLLLLVLTSSASAECAWVLWLKGGDSPHIVPYKDWTPVKGFAGLKECEGYVRSGLTASFDTRCLPDTVDPRGPKGK